MIGIIDYGMGNIFSLASALKRLDADYILTDDIKKLEACSALILPGVGAFADAMTNLKKLEMDTFLKSWAASGKPLLGICLGMQLLFDKSFEHGETPGLALIPGEVKEIPPLVKVPHMGWNNIQLKNQHPYLPNLEEGYVYFVHSFYADTEDQYIIASTEYGVEIPAITAFGSVVGIQFHPEKSSETGKKIFKELLTSWREI